MQISKLKQCKAFGHCVHVMMCSSENLASRSKSQKCKQYSNENNNNRNHLKAESAKVMREKVQASTAESYQSLPSGQTSEPAWQTRRCWLSRHRNVLPAFTSVSGNGRCVLNHFEHTERTFWLQEMDCAWDWQEALRTCQSPEGPLFCPCPSSKYTCHCEMKT